MKREDPAELTEFFKSVKPLTRDKAMTFIGEYVRASDLPVKLPEPPLAVGDHVSHALFDIDGLVVGLKEEIAYVLFDGADGYLCCSMSFLSRSSVQELIDAAAGVRS